jgi:regulator of replication initiation timing
LEVSVGSTDKTTRTGGQKSTSEIGSRVLQKNHSQKSVGKIGRQLATSASVFGNSQINHLVSGISGGFPEIPDSTSELAPSGRTSKMKKNWHVGEQVTSSPAKTAPKTDKTALSKLINKRAEERIPRTRSGQLIEQSQHQSKAGTWTKQYQNLLQEIHKMKDQIESLAEENEDMAIMLTDKSIDEPTHDLYFSKPKTIKAKQENKTKSVLGPGSTGLATFTNYASAEEDDSVIEAKLDEEDMGDAYDIKNNITGSSYSRSVTPDHLRYGEHTGLDDTEFYQHH